MDPRRALRCAVAAFALALVATPARAEPILRQGSSGSAVVTLQDALGKKGFDPGGSDGVFGSQTRAAVVAFQRSAGLAADGVVGPLTWSALLGPGTTTPPPPATGATFTSRGTGYYPDGSLLEGGFRDRRGNRLQTLQDFLAGRVSWVSVAMDVNAFPYGQKLRIAELERKYGRVIEFRVVDTGGAFRGKGRSRIDICTGSRSASLDPTINGTLHCTIVN